MSRRRVFVPVPCTSANLVLFAFVAVTPLRSQSPTATIRVTIADPSGAAIPSAQVQVSSAAIGISRMAATDWTGDCAFSGLPPGSYEIEAGANGFNRTVAHSEARVGREVRIGLTLQIRPPDTEAILVSWDGSHASITGHTVEGVISQDLISGLPLNGRNALELARLHAGVLAKSDVPMGHNVFVDVSINGQPGARTRVTVDGGSVTDFVNGGTLQNFSSEVVQEFQISLANFDVSTGIASTGALNLVTRSGSNDFHGTAFLYGRHNAIAANPQLERSPFDPSPRFDRQQYGWLASGRIIRDRLFWLSSIDRTRQRGVSDVNANNPELASFNAINPEPFDILLQTHRVDWNVGERSRINLRFSRDGNHGRAGGGLIENLRVAHHVV